MVFAGSIPAEGANKITMNTLSEYEVIYNNKIGMGYILPPSVNINDHLQAVPVTVGSETIQPNTETTLSGYFNILPALYVGMRENEMIFFLGNEEDLFESKNYYLGMIKLTEKRIFSMFSHRAGRDFNFVNNMWK